MPCLLVPPGKNGWTSARSRQQDVREYLLKPFLSKPRRVDLPIWRKTRGVPWSSHGPTHTHTRQTVVRRTSCTPDLSLCMSYVRTSHVSANATLSVQACLSGLVGYLPSYDNCLLAGLRRTAEGSLHLERVLLFPFSSGFYALDSWYTKYMIVGVSPMAEWIQYNLSPTKEKSQHVMYMRIWIYAGI